MSKNTYWISDPDGTKALVEGTDERDRWVQVHGFVEADEPTGQEFVWVANENPELGAARMNWQAATDPAWAARGWAPGPPVEPVNNAIPAERVAAANAAAAKAAEKSATKTAASGKDSNAGSKPTKSTAASGDDKE
jgi:hypothetical protein